MTIAKPFYDRCSEAIAFTFTHSHFRLVPNNEQYKMQLLLFAIALLFNEDDDDEIRWRSSCAPLPCELNFWLRAKQ